MLKKKSLLFLFAMCLTISVCAQPVDNHKRTFYIVRHAEKDTGSNPAISALGKMRAADLFRELENKRIDLIMVTNYRRTGMTGDSLRIYKKIDTMHYAADVSGEMFLKKLSTLPARYKNILVIGHSNTLSGIIRQAGAKDYSAKDIPDNEYDNLFIVNRKRRKVVLQSKKYGLPSLPAASDLRMTISH